MPTLTPISDPNGLTASTLLQTSFVNPAGTTVNQQSTVLKDLGSGLYVMSEADGTTVKGVFSGLQLQAAGAQVVT